MKRSFRFSFVTSLVALVLAIPLAAQDMPKNPWFYVHDETVHPSKASDYEKNTLEFIGMMKKHLPGMHWKAISTDDFHYYYVLDIEGFADIEKMHKGFETMMGKMAVEMGPEKLGEWMMRSGSTTSHVDTWVAVLRNDLSYMPAKPSLKPEEVKVLLYDFYYLLPGTEMMVEQLAREWVALMKKYNGTTPYSIYQPAMGRDLPVLVVATPGRSGAEIMADSEKMMMSLGKEGMALNERTMKVVRKIEHRVGTLRPDLSNMPAD